MDREKRLLLREEILGCSRCHLSKIVTAPVPLYGPLAPTVTVLGEAPGATEDSEGRPYVGASGVRLRKLLGLAGFDPETFGWVNTVSCFPRNLATDPGRAPNKLETESCRPHKLAQLKAFESKWVILTGNVPLQSFRPDLKIGQMHGRVFSLERFGIHANAFPIFHPAAVLRNPAWEQPVLDDLKWLKEWVDEPASLGELAPADCTYPGCERGSTQWDADCVTYCDDHIAKGIEKK